MNALSRDLHRQSIVTRSHVLWHLKHLLKIPTSSSRILCPCTDVVIGSPAVTAGTCPGAPAGIYGMQGSSGLAMYTRDRGHR